MDKFSDFFKTTVAVFHGIIATWLFVEFSEITVDQFQFLILLVFFSVANILMWNLIILTWHKIRGVNASVQLMTSDLAALRYRLSDVFGLMAVAIILGLVTAYAYRKDVILHAASSVVNWHRSYSDAPFNVLLSHVSGAKHAAFGWPRSNQGEDGRRPCVSARLSKGFEVCLRRLPAGGCQQARPTGDNSFTSMPLYPRPIGPINDYRRAGN
jgi:hypothetical protein